MKDYWNIEGDPFSAYNQGKNGRPFYVPLDKSHYSDHWDYERGLAERAAQTESDAKYRAQIASSSSYVGGPSTWERLSPKARIIWLILILLCILIYTTSSNLNAVQAHARDGLFTVKKIVQSLAAKQASSLPPDAFKDTATFSELGAMPRREAVWNDIVGRQRVPLGVAVQFFQEADKLTRAFSYGHEGMPLLSPSERYFVAATKRGKDGKPESEMLASFSPGVLSIGAETIICAVNYKTNERTSLTSALQHSYFVPGAAQSAKALKDCETVQSRQYIRTIRSDVPDWEAIEAYLSSKLPGKKAKPQGGKR